MYNVYKPTQTTLLNLEANCLCLLPHVTLRSITHGSNVIGRYRSILRKNAFELKEPSDS